VKPSARRQVAEALVQEHQLPIQRACRMVKLSRTAYYHPPVPASRRDAAVIAALTELVARYPRWGFLKLYDRLRVEGQPWNHKRIYRVYCALRLNLPRRTTRRVPRRIRQPLTAPPILNQTWALDFMTDTLYDSRRIRLLTVIDEGNREALEIAIGPSLPSRRVVRVLNELVALHGRPSAVRVDNGPEFTAQPFVEWCAEHGVATHYIQPGKPDQNAYIERFNRSYRPEVLNAPLRLDRRTPGHHGTVAAHLQPGAPARQPRPGATPHVSAEAYNRRNVSLGTVRLTGELTVALDDFRNCSAGPAVCERPMKTRRSTIFDPG